MPPLGIGFIGSGFNTRFHLQGLVGVRDVEVRGISSPTAKNAESAAAMARQLDLGPTKPFRSIAAMVADPGIDAIWLCGPNHARIDNVEELVDAVERDRGALRGIACEKPLGRTGAEALEVTRLVKRAGLQHG